MCFFVRFAPARAPRPFLSVFFQQSIKPTCVLPCGVHSPWGVLTRFFGLFTEETVSCGRGTRFLGDLALFVCVQAPGVTVRVLFVSALTRFGEGFGWVWRG